MTWKLYVFLYIFSSLCFVKQVSAQPDKLKIHIADSILKSRGEVYFSFSKSQFRPPVDEYISVHKLTDSLVFAYANIQGFQKLLKLNIDFHLQINTLSERLKKVSQYHFDSIYPSYSRYLNIMQGFEKQYGNYCELHQAGLSVSGRKLLMLKITASSGKTEKPAVFLSGAIHGNELTGYKLLLWLADYLLNNYGKDALVTKLMDETEIWINPLANPDGTYFGGDNTVVEATRFNASQIDLNRNFPDPDRGEHPDYAEWQPEIVALMNFLKEKKIVLSAGIHTGNEVINYPWDTWSRLHPDDSWYKLIARQYADMVHSRNNTYMNGFNNGIVNGFSWYRITGGMQDYVNYYLFSREVTIELSDDYALETPEIEKCLDYNRDALLHYLEQSLFGLKGMVTDSKDKPINAKVEILNYDKDNSWVYSDSSTGVYYRYLSAGNYTIKFTALGYNPVIKENIYIADGARTTLDVIMESNSDIYVFPNPFIDVIEIQSTQLINQAQVDIRIINIAGKVMYRKTINNNLENLIKIDLPDFPGGTYILEVKASGFKKNFKIVRK